MILFDEIRQIKINDKNNNKIINNLIKKNEELETKINTIQEENKKLKDSLNKYIDFLEQKMKESKVEKEMKQKMEEIIILIAINVINLRFILD